MGTGKYGLASEAEFDTSSYCCATTSIYGYVYLFDGIAPQQLCLSSMLLRWRVPLHGHRRIDIWHRCLAFLAHSSVVLSLSVVSIDSLLVIVYA